MNQLSLKSFFQTYPYKQFQQFFSKINQSIVAENQLNSFLKDPICFILEDNNTGLYQGIASMAFFPMTSIAFSMQCFLLKNFFVKKPTQALYDQLLEGLLKKTKNQVDFIISRQPVDNVLGIKALCLKNFYYVCMESVFTLPLEQVTFENLESFNHITMAEEKDLDVVFDLAKKNHAENRYLYDGFFDPTKVQDLYQQVIRQSYQKSNQALFVYRLKKKIIGFITTIKNQSLSQQMGFGYGSLDYIVVDKEFQKQNIGYFLNAYALKDLYKKGVLFASVKTMASNYKAIKLLHKNGFTLTSQNVLLHWKN